MRNGTLRVFILLNRGKKYGNDREFFFSKFMILEFDVEVTVHRDKFLQ